MPSSGLQGQHSFEVVVQGQSLAGVLHAPQRWPEVPCVVLCHGLLSSMESPKFKALAEALSLEGMAAVRFDFRGCGKSSGSLRESTVSGRLEDLGAVIRFLAEGFGYERTPGLMGSSMGGFVALLYAGMKAGVPALSVWSTPFAPLELKALKLHSESSRMGPVFYQDLGTHDLSSIKGRLHHLLVIHGEKDELIPISHARRIHALGDYPKSMHIIAQADHRFTHPAHRQEAFSLTIKWFSEHMR